MKIQISKEKKVDDAMVVWHEQSPDVDLVLDFRSSYKNFKPGSVKVIYSFGLLGETEPDKIIDTLKSLIKILEVGGELYIIEQDFDYILRALLGGDLSIKEFNESYRKNTYLNQDEIVNLLENVGFPNKEQRWWQESTKFTKKNSEIIISAVKNNQQ